MENQETKSRWVWRDGEISYAEFGRMDRMDKDAHLSFLQSLGEDISTNDWYILNQYAPQFLTTSRPIGFLSINEDMSPEYTAHISTTIIDDELIPTVETSFDASLMDKYELENYLNKFFKIENVRWKDDIKWSPSLDNFLKNTSNYMELDELTISVIKEYYKLK
jgi:hypothetical protein